MRGKTYGVIAGACSLIATFGYAGTQASGAGAAVTSASSTPPSTTPPSGGPTTSLRWAPCAEFECAQIELPVDYSVPSGKTFLMGLLRVPARDSTKRIGSLVTNPGGPGGSGVEYVSTFARQTNGFTDAIRDSFDIVGFDPRGVGNSKGLTCPVTVEPVTEINRSGLLQVAKSTAQNCQKTEDAAFLASITTKNVAMDMDRLRSALGDEKLTYLGLSYGTYLGATYSSLFPDRVRALALDGAIDPDQWANDPLEFDLEQLESANAVLNDIFDFCEKAGPKCPFGGGDPRTAFSELVKAYDDDPLEGVLNGVTTRVNGYTITAQTRSFMKFSPRSWPGILSVLATAARGNPEPLLLANIESDFGASTLITRCNDQHYGRDLEDWDDLIEERADIAPEFYKATAYEFAECAFLTYAADRFAGPFTNTGAAPILVIGATNDSQTPFQGALALTAELGNARLLTFDGYLHVAYRSPNECIRDKVDAYLINGVLPPVGTVCTQPPPPAL
jgi:pimeloyl-ACP methyl ester carboxylesterase